MTGLDQMDSISDPWEMLISSIWAYTCDTSSVCLTSQSGLAADLAPSSTSQVRFCPPDTINIELLVLLITFSCADPFLCFYRHDCIRSFLDAHLNAAISEWGVCLTTGKHQAASGQPPPRDLAYGGYCFRPAGCLSPVRVHYEGWARFHLFPLSWHRTVFVCAEILVLGPCLSGNITKHEQGFSNVCDYCVFVVDTHRASMSYLLLIISTKQLAEDAPKCDFEMPVALSGCIVFLSMIFYLVSCCIWLRSTLLEMSKRLHTSVLSALRAGRE